MSKKVIDIKNPYIRKGLTVVTAVLAFIVSLFYPLLEAIQIGSLNCIGESYRDAWNDLSEVLSALWNGKEKDVKDLDV
jgi:hypothetical protein